MINLFDFANDLHNGCVMWGLAIPLMYTVLLAGSICTYAIFFPNKK